MAQAPVAIVTGASRGAGKGIAVALGSHGCTVYVTGRSQKEGDASMPGTIYSTADEVTKADEEGLAAAAPEIIAAVSRLLDGVRDGELAPAPAEQVAAARTGWL